MKYVATLLLLTALVFAQSGSSTAPNQNGPPSDADESSTPGASAPAASIPVDQENVKKAKAVLDAGIQALGGQAYLDWKDMTAEGRSYSFHHGQPNSLGILFWRFREYPDKERVELTKKRDVVQIFNGDKGFEITYKGVRNLDDKDELQPYLRRHHYSLDLVLREWLHQPGIALFYEGQTIAAQKEADQVTIMNAKNEAVTLYFDINTHLPVRKTFTWRDPADRQRNVEEEIYDNYRPIQGVMTPFDVTRIFNGDMSAQYFLTTVSYNQGLSDSLFNPQVSSAKRR
jgi:hypothetical protein